MQGLARGAARFAVIVVAVAAFVAAVGLAFALLAHFQVRRGISIAYYAVGALIMVMGVLHGLRPPVRVEREQGVVGMLGVMLTHGHIRRATPEERDDALASSGLFVAMGILLVVLGGLLDPVHHLL